MRRQDSPRRQSLKGVLVAGATVLLASGIASAQLPVNAPNAHTAAAPRATYATTATPFAIAAAPSTTGMGSPSPLPPSALEYRNGNTYADNSTIKAFDAARGLLTLGDDEVIHVPRDFAITDTLAAGQPITVYYYRNQAGQNVLSSYDMESGAGLS